jgi:hypothetical protein
MIKFLPFTLITAYTPCKLQQIQTDTEAFGKGVMMVLACSRNLPFFVLN